jgi:hypothetical protein
MNEERAADFRRLHAALLGSDDNAPCQANVDRSLLGQYAEALLEDAPGAPAGYQEADAHVASCAACAREVIQIQDMLVSEGEAEELYREELLERQLHESAHARDEESRQGNSIRTAQSRQ